jgi:predicted transcriptional regulator
MNEKITELYNANATTQAIADALNLEYHQVQDALARLRKTGVLTLKKRTTEAEAREALTQAGADFDALASDDHRVLQPEAEKLLDAKCRVADIAKFTRVKRQRVYAWAKGREARQ